MAYELSDFMYGAKDEQRKSMSAKEMEMVCRMIAQRSEASRGMAKQEMDGNG